VTIQPQLTLFALPRRLDPGEPVRCLDCARCDHEGGYGPPVLIEYALVDGSGWTEPASGLWFCAKHAAQRWAHHLDPKRRAKVAGRRERLAVFLACQREGFRGSALFAEAEARLNDPTHNSQLPLEAP
jgi:hypothetical protein